MSHLDPQVAKNQIEQITAYQPLPAAIDRRVRLHEPSLPDQVLCAMAWAEEPNEQGYWGETVTPIECPDTSRWPSERKLALERFTSTEARNMSLVKLFQV